MSSTLSTSQMVSILQTRTAIGLSSTQALGYINQAFRWINTQGAFVWLLRKATVAPGVNGLFACPADFDPGKAKWLTNDVVGLPIPFKSIEDALSNVDAGGSFAPGAYTVWTLLQVTSGFTLYGYNGQVYPVASTVGAPDSTLYYHTKPATLPNDPTAYFPTPDVFDDSIVDLAEAEVRRIYNMVGWETVQSRAQGAVLAMVDGYRTSIPDGISETDQERRSKQQAAARVP